VKAACILVLACGTAAAEPEFHDAISLELATAQATSLSLQADHALDRKWSVAGAVGVREAAMGDFGSYTLGAGLALRRWKSHQLRGWYAGARADVSATHMTDEMQHASLGTTWTSSIGLEGGYRFVLFHALELTPSLGLAEVFERGPMEPVTARPAMIVGLTAGVIFR